MLDYFPHMYVFHQERTGFDQEYYALNKNIMHLFSGSLSFSLSGFF